MHSLLLVLSYVASIIQGIALGVFILTFVHLRFKESKKEFNLLALSSLVIVIGTGFISV